MPSLNVTTRRRPFAVSDSTAQSDISATKSCGLWAFQHEAFPEFGDCEDPLAAGGGVDGVGAGDVDGVHVWWGFGARSVFKGLEGGD